MKYLRQFLIGLRAYLRAAKIIFTTQIWLSFSIPLLLSIGLYFGGDVLADNLADFDLSDIGEDSGAQYLLIGVQSLAVYITKYMTKYLVIALLAPLLTAISTQVEFRITGNTYPFNLRYYIEDVIRALTITARNIILQIMAMGVVYGITYVYGLPNVINEGVYYITSFYFYGFAFLDYANERRRLSVSESVKFTRRHFGPPLPWAWSTVCSGTSPTPGWSSLPSGLWWQVPLSSTTLWTSAPIPMPFTKAKPKRN